MQSRQVVEHLVFWLPIVGGLLLGSIAANEWYSGAKVNAVWFGFAGIVCFLAVAAVQLQRALETPNSTDRSKEASIAQIRAYVHPNDGDVLFEADGRPTVSISIKNTGQTPAFKLTWIAKFVLASGADGPEFSFDPNEIKTPVTLPPGGVLSYKYKFEIWSENFNRLLEKREAFIFAIGEIRYTDAFDVQRYTDYRLISSGKYANGSGISPGKFGTYVTGNNSN